MAAAEKNGRWAMTESSWKVVMDRDGLTISGDRFKLTTSGAEPTQLEAVVSELQSVTRATYGQYCGLSRAAEMVGERWGLLIIRDLLVSPKTVAELHNGLPRISEKLLTTRLKEMEYSGVIRRRDPVDGDHVVYELTEYGRALEEALLALGRWGAISLATPRPEDIVTADSLIVAIRASFMPQAARGVHLTFVLNLGDIVLHAKIDDGAVAVGSGALADADAVINPGAQLKALLTGEISAEEALASRQVSVSGDPAMLNRFVELFQLPRLKAPVPA